MPLDSATEKQFFDQWSHDGDGEDAEYIAAHCTEGVLHMVGQVQELATEVDEEHACHDERNAQPNGLDGYFGKAFQIEFDILEMDKVPDHGDA